MLSSSITAVAGENYEEQIKTVTFIPYETEKTIEIPVSGEGEFKLLMSDMTGCESGKYAETVVKIKITPMMRVIFLLWAMKIRQMTSP